jgi:hypothetical protein
MKSTVPDISSLYRLPYSKNDNPNGWVEITTHCNLKCPGCYRGCHRDDNIALHENLEDVKNNIKEMQRIRNCQIISLSGGEPLLHPQLNEIVAFIRDSGMIPFVHTNGLLLTEELIRQLKSNGLGGLIIRVDSLSRNREKNEEDLNRIRQKYGEMVARIRGVHLTFLCVVNKENINEIGKVIDWSVRNAQLVDFVTFIPMRQILFTEEDIADDSSFIYIGDLCREVAQKIPDVEYASYLGGTVAATSIKWLQSPWVVLNGKIIGYTGPAFIEFFQVSHHYLTGRYAYKFGKDRSHLNYFLVLLLSLFFRSFRNVARRYTLEIIRNPLNLFRRATVQLLCFIVPPEIINGKKDLCDGCPDAILYKGELVPSCALEEIKKYGDLVTER